ncbi:MAG: type I DNA topoisomerase, partial [Nitrososphaeraceae archaeon]|nr:type I DNA topoisomerase [Nitrososphaeraceae archaeon]
MPIVLVVESPNKIKKIEHILGNGYKVIASVGHIMDLDPNKMSVELDNDFKPIYIVNIDKKTVVANIKKVFNSATELLLATDEDREGEMIAWSIANVLKLDIKKAKRITFNAITKSEITNAIKNPRIINTNLVDAQKARRILDRIVGYELSPLLSKHLGSGNLSAGRVQSVVARLIVDRENEIKKFLSGDMKSYFKFKGEFTSNKKLFNANAFDLEGKSKNNEYKGEQSKIIGEDKSKKFMETCSKSTFKVEHVFDKKKTRGPSPPFTTSTLQQDANRKCGFSVKKTMMVAQKLYEAGYITYMRTDSVNLSDEAMKDIKKYITEIYGEEYYRYGQYKSKSKNTQEAHEAIRPTELFTTDISDEEHMGTDEVRLYSLIWKRAVASQMKPAEFNITSIQISISKDKDHFFQTSIENLTFAGFLTVYNVAEEEENEEEDNEASTNKDVPIPKVGDVLPLESLLGSQEYLKPP